MDNEEWFHMIDKICEAKGKMFPIEGYPMSKERYVSCIDLKKEMLKGLCKK